VAALLQEFAQMESPI